MKKVESGRTKKDYESNPLIPIVEKDTKGTKYQLGRNTFINENL